MESSSRAWSRGGHGWSRRLRWCPAFSAREAPSQSSNLAAWPTESREILAEEEDLAAGLSKTWNTDAAGMPRLHAGFDQLVAAAASPVWELPASPHSPGAAALAASGWDRVHGSIEPLAARLRDLTGRGYRVVLGAPGGASARLGGLLADHGASVEPAETILGRGAVLEGIKLALLSETDVTGRRRAHRSPRTRSRDQRRFLADLVPGAFVVHQHHGVARFEGMVRRAIGGHEREYLLLAYRGRDRLYVPSDQIASIRHYTGGEAPTLSRMGGSDWAATKNRVKRAVAEVAQELVVLYQKRMTTAGHAFDPDTPWQRELEDSFEYQDTRDQQHAVAEVKRDMERPVPMDRLLVGTWASARPRSRFGPRSRRFRAGARWRCWCPPHCWPSSTPRRSVTATDPSRCGWRP